MKVAVFDIETGPRPESELADVQPEFKAPANYKDPEKIAAAIAEQKKEWLERAALSAVTGRVLAVGWRQDGVTTLLCDETEGIMIALVWKLIEEAARAHYQVVGFNSNRFDLPFLTRRSWALGIPVPAGLYGARGYVNQNVFIDLMDEWACGDRQSTISLDRLAKFLGCGEKNGDGKIFSHVLAEDRARALAYLDNDIPMTARVAERLLGVPQSASSTAPAATAAKPKAPGQPAAPALVLQNDDDDY
ncbi:MAG: hypothetical protein ACKV19_24570 [Verrucomicrobiales bacterium]